MGKIRFCLQTRTCDGTRNGHYIAAFFFVTQCLCDIKWWLCTALNLLWLGLPGGHKKLAVTLPFAFNLFRMINTRAHDLFVFFGVSGNQAARTVCIPVFNLAHHQSFYHPVNRFRIRIKRVRAVRGIFRKHRAYFYFFLFFVIIHRYFSVSASVRYPLSHGAPVLIPTRRLLDRDNG